MSVKLKDPGAAAGIPGAMASPSEARKKTIRRSVIRFVDCTSDAASAAWRQVDAQRLARFPVYPNALIQVERARLPEAFVAAGLPPVPEKNAAEGPWRVREGCRPGIPTALSTAGRGGTYPAATSID